MANEVKSKIVSISSSIKTKLVDGERRIVFVASSANIDRHYEQVNVASLRLPLKGGGDITVDAIPAEGITDIVDIPLMLNHSGDVRDVIGSVRTAYFQNGELIFEAGISSRDVAQEMLTLIEEGHLSNAFSITMIDYDYNFDADTISNAEIIEVSLVYRGSNKEARLIAIKSLLGGQTMSEPVTKQNDTFGDANGDGKDHSQTEKPVETPKEEKPAETTETQPVETPTETEAETPESTDKTDEKVDENVKSNTEEKAMTKEIAKDTVVEKATQPVQTAKSNGDYLKSKAALKDFKDIVLKYNRGSNEQIMKAWMENLKEKAITGDAILPARIESIFFKAWQDQPSALAAFRQMGARAGAVYSMGTSDTARGHAKGATKVNQNVAALRRDVKAINVYKKLPIDLQDLFDDESGELLAFRVEELASRVANQIVVAALLGGTKEGAVGTPTAGRGLYGIVDDSTAATGTFGASVATAIAGVTADTNYDAAIKTLGAIRGNGAKTLFVPFGFRTALLLAKNSAGLPIFPVGTNLDTAIGATIYELDELTADGLIIGVLDGAYVLFGEANATVRTDFDLTNNQDIMLVERFVGGSLTGFKTAAVYTPAP